jgi:hypothetical protein
MANNPAADRQYAHDLIDRIAPGQVDAVVGLLEIMLNPFARALASAPYDDEPVTEEEAREAEASKKSLARGEGIPHEQILAEFGLTTEDFERMGRAPIK